MLTIWLGYALAASATSALLVAAGRRSRATAVVPNRRTRRAADTLALLREDARGSDHTQSCGNAAEAIRAALEQLQPVIIEDQVRIDVATGPDLLIRARPAALAEMVAAVLGIAIRAAPGRHFLLTASRHGGYIEIVVSDDSNGGDPELRRGQLRQLAQRAALLGGSLDIAMVPNQGATMTLRLVAAAPRTPAEAATTRSQENARQLL